MLKKPENYEAIEVKEFDYTPIELGGHKLVIKTAEEYTSATSGKSSIKVVVDTTKTDKQPNYFQAQFDNDTRDNKKWSNGATKYISLQDDEFCERMLKTFITSVEKSNLGFKFDWSKDVKQLNGKFIGGVFGIEEYVNQNGEVKEARKLTQFRSFDKVDNVSIPKVKTLENGYVSYDDYAESKENNNANSTDPFKEFGDTVEIDDNFLD